MSRPPRYYYEHIFDEFAPVIRQYASGRARFAPGESLYRLGEVQFPLFYVESGVYKTLALTEDGREMTCLFLGPGTLYPPKSQSLDFSNEGSFLFRAATELSVLTLPVERAGQLFLDHPAIALRALDFRTMETHLMTSRLAQSSIRSGQRVCNFLYLFYVDMNGVDLPISQEDVASMTELSRVQVARVYQRLRREGVIASSRRGVRILDARRLYDGCSHPLIP